MILARDARQRINVPDVLFEVSLGAELCFFWPLHETQVHRSIALQHGAAGSTDDSSPGPAWLERGGQQRRLLLEDEGKESSDRAELCVDRPYRTALAGLSGA